MCTSLEILIAWQKQILEVRLISIETCQQTNNGRPIDFKTNMSTNNPFQSMENTSWIVYARTQGMPATFSCCCQTFFVFLPHFFSFLAKFCSWLEIKFQDNCFFPCPGRKSWLKNKISWEFFNFCFLYSNILTETLRIQSTHYIIM